MNIFQQWKTNRVMKRAFKLKSAIRAIWTTTKKSLRERVVTTQQEYEDHKNSPVPEPTHENLQLRAYFIAQADCYRKSPEAYWDEAIEVEKKYLNDQHFRKQLWLSEDCSRARNDVNMYINNLRYDVIVLRSFD